MADPNEPYTVFTSSQVKLIVGITCLAGTLSGLSANIYFPALGAIQRDLNTTTQAVNLTVTVYLIFQALSPTFWGSLADKWGRRPVYILTLSIYIGACIGLALTPVYWLLLVLRMLQPFGSSSTIAIGAGVVGDVVESSKRGGYYGITNAAQLLGIIIGPVIGGIMAEELSWRWSFWLLVILSAIALVLVFLFVPETLRSLVGNGSGYANPTPFQWWAHRKEGKSNVSFRRFLVLPNFTAPFRYLFEPDVCLGLIFNGLHYAAYYCYLIVNTDLFEQQYGLNSLQVGLTYLCNGSASILGSIIQGKVLDRDYRLMKEKHSAGSEFPIHSTRLRSVWIHAGLSQVCILLYGWCAKINAHLAVLLVIQFIGTGTAMAIMNTFQTLLVDLFPGKGASITASNNLVRCLLGAVATVSMNPAIQRIGIGWIFTIVGVILVLSNAVVPVLLTWGPKWKKRRADKEAAKEAAKESMNS